jgi:hypothetical protein
MQCARHTFCTQQYDSLHLKGCDILLHRERRCTTYQCLLFGSGVGKTSCVGFSAEIEVQLDAV